MSTQLVPWNLLLRSLRHSDSTVISFADVTRAGADADVLVAGGFAELGGADAYTTPRCRHSVLPLLDFERRCDEALVGVACPVEPACWPGWTWVPRAEVTMLRPRTSAVLTALAHRNGLGPIDTAVPPPFVAVGLLAQRGLSVPVVWLRDPTVGFELLCRALRAHLGAAGADGLVVLVGTPPPARFDAAERICVIELPTSPDGDLRLLRALEELRPGYRDDALADPTLDFDHIHLRLASDAGDRHAVWVNGHDFGGFRKSDVKFFRLLLLAVARKQGRNDGWVPKRVLCGKDLKDHALERLRNELGLYLAPGLREAELRALVRSHRGCVRLAVPPTHIELDLTLGSLAFVGPAAQPSQGRTRPRVTPLQQEGLANAHALLRACQELVGIV